MKWNKKEEVEAFIEKTQLTESEKEILGVIIESVDTPSRKNIINYLDSKIDVLSSVKKKVKKYG